MTLNIYENVRELRTKTDALLNSIRSNKYDIIAFTESWLVDGTRNEELEEDVFRQDLNYCATGQPWAVVSCSLFDASWGPAGIQSGTPKENTY